MRPKTSKFEKISKGVTKTRKVEKKEASLKEGQALGPHFADFWIHFSSQNGAQILIYSIQKNNTISSIFFDDFWCFLMIFGVNFRTLEPSEMSISSRRNTDFHKIGLPNARSKKNSPQGSKQTSFGCNV